MIRDLEILELIGQTQDHVAYKAIHTPTGKDCILRRYLSGASHTLSSIKDWHDQLQERLNTYSQLDQTGVRSILGGGVDSADNYTYVIYEDLPAQSLESLLEDFPHIPNHIAQPLLEELVNSLYDMQSKGVILGDITPKSIFYTTSLGKNSWFLDICPLSELKTQHGVISNKHSPHTPPETLGGQSLNFTSDLFSLASIINAFSSPNDLSLELQVWLKRALSPAIENRFPDAASALNGMAHFTACSEDTLPINDLHYTPAPRPATPIRTCKPRYKEEENHAGLISAVAAAFLIFGIFSYLIFQNQKSVSTTPKITAISPVEEYTKRLELIEETKSETSSLQLLTDAE